MDKLLTFNESAAFLEINDEEFKLLIDEYKIPHYKIADKFIRFSQQELKQYIDIIKENRPNKDRDMKMAREMGEAREIEYRREDLSSIVKILEFFR